MRRIALIGIAAVTAVAGSAFGAGDLERCKAEKIQARIELMQCENGINAAAASAGGDETGERCGVGYREKIRKIDEKYRIFGGKCDASELFAPATVFRHASPVLLFEGTNYRGRWQSLCPGRYDGVDLFAVHAVRSIRVPAGWQVVLYEEEGFKGGTRTVSSDADSLGDFSGKAASVVVQSPPTTFTLYSRPDYRGNCQSFTDAVPDLSLTEIGKGSVASVKVPHGAQVVLYDRGNFQGSALHLASDAPTLGHFINRSWSAEIKLPVVLCENIYYGGRCQSLTPGRFELPELSVGSEPIRSVRVPFGWRVTLYQNSGFQGRMVTLTTDTPRLPAQGGATASIVVEGPIATAP